MNDLVIYFKSSSQLFCVLLNQAKMFKITDVLLGVCFSVSKKGALFVFLF